jgi:hypothetical protein
MINKKIQVVNIDKLFKDNFRRQVAPKIKICLVTDQAFQMPQRDLIQKLNLANILLD